MGLLVTTPAPTTAAAAAVTTTAAPAAAAFGLGAGLVDCQRAAVLFFAVEGRDRRLGFLVAAHLDEAEAFGTAGVAVHDHLRRLHGAVSCEHLLQITIVDTVGQVAHVQLLAHERASEKLMRTTT